MTWQNRLKIVPAVYILLERDGKMLFLRRFNTGYYDGQYTLPAGHMDGNEAPSTAAAREVLEETGTTVDPADLEMVHCVMYRAVEGDHERVSLFFRARRFTGEPRIAEPNKCDDIRWSTADALPAELVWEVRHALEQIAEHRSYSELNY